MSFLTTSPDDERQSNQEDASGHYVASLTNNKSNSEWELSKKEFQLRKMGVLFEYLPPRSTTEEHVDREEEPEVYRRKSQDEPLVSLVQGLVTPSKTTVNASGEEQVEYISPTTLEAAKTLSRVASQKLKSIDKGRRYKRRKETKGKMLSGLGFKEEVSTGMLKELIRTSLAEAIRLDTLEKEEEAKQVHLDSLLAQRLAKRRIK
ncbi:hypothetical protein Tco_0226498 [Tanacetum coccineum]